MRTRPALLAAVVGITAIVHFGTAGAQSASPVDVGRFSAPFEDQRPEEGSGACVVDADGRKLCKPAAGTMVMLPNGKVLYWDALEGTENIELALVAEFGRLARNSRTRVLDVSGPQPAFTTPTPEDGGANPDGNDSSELPLLSSAPEPGDVVNDGDLFCSDQVVLADGRVLAVGGSDYYNDPALPGTPYGVVELEGLKNARIFDPASQTWSQSGSMSYGRWYPSLVTLPDGRVLVMSGVTKLLKPIYPDRPFDSGTNVKQLEVYDPATGAWAALPASANRSLPLFPRLHLLPNGHVYYDVAGQSFNPMGQAYDEAFWNLASTFDPASGTWHDLGIPGVASLNGLVPGNIASDPLGAGFRGSTFSVMLTLRPDTTGQYTSASFLSAGGTLSAVAPSPGTYVATNRSRINTISIDPATGAESLHTMATGNLNNPRWYSTSVLLPTGDVMAFSGADVDEVATPSLGRPVQQAELYDHETGAWKAMASANRPRTYHNTATLLPDGRVLVGGHAPISTLYLFNQQLPLTNPNPDRDPSFEIYEPPYLFRGDRPELGAIPGPVGYGGLLELETKDAATIESVVMMRNTAVTHLVDGDQRSVELPIVARTPNAVVVATPPQPAVAPPGPYLVFANERINGELVPSVGQQASVGGPAPALAAPSPAPLLPVVPTLPQSPVPSTLPTAGDVLRLLGGRAK